jgi:hypothetical protein
MVKKEFLLGQSSFWGVVYIATPTPLFDRKLEHPFLPEPLDQRCAAYPVETGGELPL